jgi:hypothetical protein
MGWKGAARSFGSVVRQMERDSARNRRELEKRQAQYNKMQLLEQAAYDVEVYENYIERIISLHKDCGEIFNWEQIKENNPPIRPIMQNPCEETAKKKLASYKSSLIDKIFKLTEKKIKKLNENIVTAKLEDDNVYKKELQEYDQKLSDYNDLVTLAAKISSGELEYYRKAIEEMNPFTELSDIGSNISLNFDSTKRVTASISIHDENVIPKQSKSLLKSGKLSVKDMPIGRYNELYQDYVCSSSLRVGREIFAILPVAEIIVNAVGNVLNQTTGRIEEMPLLSVLLVRETMDRINFSLIDPSDCMKNFKYNMGFKKSQGMSPVEIIKTNG